MQWPRAGAGSLKCLTCERPAPQGAWSRCTWHTRWPSAACSLGRRQGTGRLRTSGSMNSCWQLQDPPGLDPGHHAQAAACTEAARHQCLIRLAAAGTQPGDARTCRSQPAPPPPPSHASQESVTVFVHDVERPVEAALVQQYFAADAGIVSLGLLQGATGNLAAFRVVA